MYNRSNQVIQKLYAFPCFFFYLTNLSEKTVMAREVERSTFCCGDQIFQVTMNKMTRSTVQSQRNRVRFPSKRKTKQAC